MNKRPVQDLKRRDLSPEEILARGQRARLRFRAAIRFVIKNLYWLKDDDEEELGDDVSRNISLLTGKQTKKSLLTLKEKGILCKRAEYRTDAEKLLLTRKISGLKCFRRYPMNVKNQLAGVTYFYYFEPGRTIVRQGHDSDGLYFIITGTVTVSQESYDPVFDKMISRDVGIMTAGSMFEEIALLHDIPRTSTVTSRTHVELLCLKKDDYNVVLRSTVQEQWEAVKSAMQLFIYFDDWEKTTIRDGCILGKLKTFLPHQTILGDGNGYDDYVYFILSGRCQVIEHLLVTSEIKNGKKLFKLYVPPSSSIDTSTSNHSSIKEEDTEEVKEEKPKEETTVSEDDLTKLKSKSVVVIDDDNQQSDEKFKIKRRESSVTFKSSSLALAKRQLSKNKFKDQFALSHISLIGSSSTEKKAASKSASSISLTSAPSKSTTNILSNTALPSYVETYFMQVCILNPTGCFNIGEYLKHRRIVATTTTECLLIPRYWLIQQNKGNIWNKIRQFLSTHIPTTKQVFQEFVKQRKWIAYRKKIVEGLQSNRKISNNNINNVPYFIRINEEIHIC